MLTKTLSEAKKKQRNILIKAMNNDIGSIDSAKDSWNPAQISERTKDISYIRSLVDTWNPAQLNEALRMLDLPVIDTWNPAQIEEQRRNLVFYLAERTLNGNPITVKILGNLTPEVTGLKVTMLPIQDTSQGDPSFTNICPITGRSDVSVIRTAGEDVETKTHEYSETIYGGVDDFVSGELVNEYELFVPKLESIGQSSGLWYWAFRLPETSTNSISTNGLMSSHFKPVNQSVEIGNCYITGNGTLLVCVPEDQTLNTATLVNAWLEENELQFAYKPVTPTTIETTPEEITLLKGTNVLSTDGDSIELKYKQNF